MSFNIKGNYYATSFFWSTLAKIVNAVVGFVSIPLLLKYFGVENYGVLSLAIAANAYIHLLDMGLNIGSVKFFSEWRSKGNHVLIDRVAGTSISFYGCIGILNAIILISIALWGRSCFNVDDTQFALLQTSLFILSIFSIFNWITTVFSQLLISANRISFTQQIAGLFSALRILVIVVTLYWHLSLNEYFFFYTLLTAFMIFPYYFKCRKLELINSILPRFYWGDFKVVLMYSLSIFTLTFFQMTASNSRPLLLGAFATNAAKMVAEYRIIEVFPIFILSIGGMLTSILLPKASTIISSNNNVAKEIFVYKGTRLTTILCACLCFPVILSAPELLQLYVGAEYVHLSFWLQLWCFTFVFSLHTTPCNSLILAQGKIKPLVVITIVACVISIFLNIFMCQYIGVGSAIIAYFIYVLMVMSFNYIYYYSKILLISRSIVFKSAFYPSVIAIISAFSVHYIFTYIFVINTIIVSVVVKSIAWLIVYVSALLMLGLLDLKNLKN